MFKLESGEIKVVQIAEGDDEWVFATKREFHDLVENKNLSKQNLTNLWNSFAGNDPFADLAKLKKFRNRPYGVEQIWKAIQRLMPGEPTGEPDGDVAAEPNAPVAAAEKPKSKQKQTKTAKASTHSQNGFREGTKAAQALGLIKRESGATIKELMDKFGWQPHTVRGFVSTLGSKHGVKVKTEKHETKGLVYKA